MIEDNINLNVFAGMVDGMMVYADLLAKGKRSEEFLRQLGAAIAFWAGGTQAVIHEINLHAADGIRHAKVGDKIFEVIEDTVMEERYIAEYEVEDVGHYSIRYAGEWVTFAEMERELLVFGTRNQARAFIEELEGRQSEDG